MGRLQPDSLVKSMDDHLAWSRPIFCAYWQYQTAQASDDSVILFCADTNWLFHLHARAGDASNRLWVIRRLYLRMDALAISMAPKLGAVNSLQVDLAYHKVRHEEGHG